MTQENTSPEREELFQCLLKGRQKIHTLMIQSGHEKITTWEENCAMIEFLRISCKKEYDMRMSGQGDDIRIDELFPECHTPTFARNLRDIAGVETVRGLLSTSSHSIRLALANESACLMEVVVAMIPHVSAMTYTEYLDFLDHEQQSTLM